MWMDVLLILIAVFPLLRVSVGKSIAVSGS
jgi:hypothetical protein